MSQLFCGAAKRDISPRKFPMGMCIVGRPFGGIVHPIYIRVIAVKAGDTTALVLCFENGGSANGAALLTQIQERFGVAPEYVMMPKTHSHTAPFSAGESDYAVLVDKMTIEAVAEALENLQPAKMGIAYGKSYININRNQRYEIRHEDGTVSHKVEIGNNAEGISDKTLSLVRFDTLNDKPIAFLLNHPTHAVVLNLTDKFGGLCGISGDFPGFTSSLLEEKYEGSIAVWTSGAAGDQNPIWMGCWFGPNEKDGAQVIRPNGPDTVDMTKSLAALHYNDIMILNRTLESNTADLDIRGAADMSVTPGRIIKLKPSPAFRPEVESIEPEGGTYEIDMQLLCIGDLSLIGVGGELYTSLGLNLKEKAECPNPVIVTHNGVRTVGYILDDEGIAFEGHGYAASAIRPGFVKDSLVEVTNRMYANAK